MPKQLSTDDWCKGQWCVPRRILSSWQRKKSQIRTVPSSEQVANLLSVGEKLDQTDLQSVTAAASYGICTIVLKGPTGSKASNAAGECEQDFKDSVYHLLFSKLV